MGAGRVHSSQLDEFVRECDRRGGPENPTATAYLSDFELSTDTKLNQAADPFSEEYFADQIRPYTELSGRPFNPLEGEQAPLDVQAHVRAANPYSVRDAHFIMQARARHSDYPAHGQRSAESSEACG